MSKGNKMQGLQDHATRIVKQVSGTDDKFHHDKALEVLQEMLDTAGRINNDHRCDQNVVAIQTVTKSSKLLL